jgi:integrase
MARVHYAQAVAFDAEARNADHRFASIGFVDEEHVAALRAIVAGRSDTAEIEATIGGALDYFHKRGNHTHASGSPEWRALARSLAQAELAALAVTAARDEGDADPPVPLALQPPANETPTTVPGGIMIRDLFGGYRAELEAAKKGRSAPKWAPIIDSLVDFTKDGRADRITRRDAIRWKDHLLEKGLAPKTTRDFYLAMVRAAFAWATDNELIEDNPFAAIKVRVAKPILTRERGFNDNEALAILKAARRYQPPTPKEQPPMIAAKRWTPFLAAYTGARIAELTQLRGQDFHERDGIHYVRITPEAGSVKTNEFRDVPLHPHLVDLGLLDMVRKAGKGPIFYREPEGTPKVHPSRVVADRVGKWVRDLAIADPAVQPNHGWRHRFKTQGRELGIDPRVIDAIQGHAARTAGEGYGDVTIKAKSDAIARIPKYAI